jgi:hypothetical protein
MLIYCRECVLCAMLSSIICLDVNRLGICVTQVDPKLLERGIACAPGTVGTFDILTHQQ